MSTFFDSFTSSEVKREFNQLPAGEHHVRIERVEATNDRQRTLNSGEMKDSLPPWKDETPQLFTVFMAVNAKGGTAHRYNGLGYVRYDELEDTKGYISLGDDYAVNEETMRRIVSEERTQKCANILNDLFDACRVVKRNEAGEIISLEKLPVGSGVKSLVGCELKITVFEKPYGDRTVYRVKNPKALQLDTVEATVPEKEESF